jgi:hypothetical protein
MHRSDVASDDGNYKPIVRLQPTTRFFIGLLLGNWNYIKDLNDNGSWSPDNMHKYFQLLEKPNTCPMA